MAFDHFGRNLLYLDIRGNSNAFHHPSLIGPDGQLSRGPTRDELVAFYCSSKTLKLEAAEKDPYSFVYAQYGGRWLMD
jgi:hypothetical protein